MAGDSMDLICYTYPGWEPLIRPASPKRQWMEETGERYAYRCLPLAIANAHGWELLSPVAFEARWDGDIHNESVEIRPDPGSPAHRVPVSLFGYGTITFHIEGIFRTPPGWSLWIGGSPNLQKDAIQPLGGVVETDWSPYTFTMNWRFTRADTWIRFEENEPIAFLFPVQRGAVERFTPRIVSMNDAPQVREQFDAWSASRNAFQKWVAETQPEAPSAKWQKLYYRGLDAHGAPGAADHQAKLRLAPFLQPDGSPLQPPEPTTCPMRHRPPPPAAASLTIASAEAVTLGASATANPALSLALQRLDFEVKPEPPSLGVPVQAEAGEARRALERRDWILEVMARQRLLAPRHQQVERVRGLSGEDFLADYYALHHPVIIEGAIDDWPALRWTPEAMAAKVGGAEIDYQGGRDGDPEFELYKDRHTRRMPFDRYIAAITASGYGNDAYVTAYNSATNARALAPLMADLRPIRDYLTGRDGMMWIGPMGTFTPLHFDLTNNLLAQVLGSKRLVLLPPSETPRLYNRRHVFSDVHDITDPDRLDRYPLARDAISFEVDLEAGDLLFIPLGWWHQVTALDFSVTLTYTDFRWPNEGHRSFPAD